MRKVLTTEEWIAKRRAEAAERKKRSKPAKESKDAQVTAYRQFTKINSQAVYRGGCYDPKGYENYFPSEMNAHDIGREARKALLASRFIAPDHPEWDAVMRFPTADEIRAAQEANKARAGVKTLKALFNGAGNVSLRLQDGQIEITPWRYRGRGHWEGIRGHEDPVLPEDVSDETLGKAILDALDVSRSA
ncbi:contact-dependent growth inhibition system immunity protein [Epibacterium sp. MM17-32]|uniref:contact-dependent growth inhibition system immunity protein n=1 Tax=Epibacterium sp. MM17-32 TaxID=2917734 RepID=UPI001EF6950A|nr:contact-dependent growth inhibition system immunity protein [Epibacterium sp. MM17-32]MCG7630081.1 contact-dependent growth inhibition system immunity protein [Epibacterium sp. MM17-32]